MHEARPLHAPGKRDDVLRADYVRAQSTFQSWIERDVAGRVENDIDILGDAFSFLFRKPQVVFSDVAADDRDLVANETVERRAVTLAQRIERRRADNVVPETCFGFLLRASAHRHVNLADIRKAMQQHAKRHFAQKARAADQKKAAVPENFGWRKCIVGHRFSESVSNRREVRSCAWRRSTSINRLPARGSLALRRRAVCRRPRPRSRPRLAESVL